MKTRIAVVGERDEGIVAHPGDRGGVRLWRQGAVFAGTALEFVACDENGESRALRLRGHPFFGGTLFRPERRALRGELHPAVRAFWEAAGR